MLQLCSHLLQCGGGGASIEPQGNVELPVGFLKLCLLLQGPEAFAGCL